MNDMRCCFYVTVPETFHPNGMPERWFKEETLTWVPYVGVMYYAPVGRALVKFISVRPTEMGMASDHIDIELEPIDDVRVDEARERMLESGWIMLPTHILETTLVEG